MSTTLINPWDLFYMFIFITFLNLSVEYNLVPIEKLIKEAGGCEIMWNSIELPYFNYNLFVIDIRPFIYST